jgi:hypothetical protein
LLRTIGVCYDKRVFTRYTGRAASRIAKRHGQQFVKHVVPAVTKPARTLWNEFIGFVFLCFGVIFGFKTGRLAIDYVRPGPEDGIGELIRLAIAGFCTLVMVWFGVTSFWRARKISRS